MFLKNSIKFDNTIVILIAFLVNSICCRVSLRSTSGRPNIVFILADDLVIHSYKYFTYNLYFYLFFYSMEIKGVE